MKYTYLLLLCFSLLLAACGADANANEQDNTQNTDNTEVNANMDNESTEAGTTANTETGMSASETTPETPKTGTAVVEGYEKEMGMINEEIMTINQKMDEYKGEEGGKDVEGVKWTTMKYLNKDGVVRKITASSEGASWEMYFIALDASDNKLIYSKYVEAAMEGGLPTVREFYSIGSMVEGPENFPLILDESGQQVQGSDLMKYNELYDDAFINLTN